MDLQFTAEEQAFRAEVRQWVADNLPPDIRTKVLNAQRLSKDDQQRWARILGFWVRACALSLLGGK